jgi:hypothetical protein
MSYNFIAVDREQELLLPPSLNDWLPQNHLAWFVLSSVAEMDLASFNASYRADGHGRPAHDPAMWSRCCSMPMRWGSVPRG